MTLKKRFIACSALFFCWLALPVQAATFEVPRSFEIMYVDLESSRNFGNDFKVEVDEGQHQIVVRFNKLLRSGGDTEMYQSEPIVLDLAFDKGTYLMLKASYISNPKQAKSFSKEPTFTIVDDVSGKEVRYRQEVLPVQSGLQNTRNYVNEIERLNSEKLSVANGPAPAPFLMKEDITLDRLQYWYNLSDDTTRKEIRIWMADDLYKPNVSNIQLEMTQFWFDKATYEDKKMFQTWLVE